MKIKLNSDGSYVLDYAYGQEYVHAAGGLYDQRILGRHETYLEIDDETMTVPEWIRDRRSDKAWIVQATETNAQMAEEIQGLKDELAGYKAAMDVIKRHGMPDVDLGYEARLLEKDAEIERQKELRRWAESKNEERTREVTELQAALKAKNDIIKKSRAALDEARIYE